MAIEQAQATRHAQMQQQNALTDRIANLGQDIFGTPPELQYAFTLQLAGQIDWHWPAQTMMTNGDSGYTGASDGQQAKARDFNLW